MRVSISSPRLPGSGESALKSSGAVSITDILCLDFAALHPPGALPGLRDRKAPTSTSGRPVGSHALNF